MRSELFINLTKKFFTVTFLFLFGLMPMISADIKVGVGTMLKPEYVNRVDEEILFVRKTGDYNDTPDRAFPILKKFLKENGIDNRDIKAFYGIILDDQHIVERSKCRFDACVALKIKCKGKGEVGNKMLRGGHYAVFNHYGSGTPAEIEETLDKIFCVWYPSLKEESLGDSVPFLEFVHCLNKGAEDHERLTKIYIPLNKKSIEILFN